MDDKVIRWLKIVLAIFTSMILVLSFLYIMSLSGFTYIKTVDRVSIYLRMDMPRCTPTIVLLISLAMQPIAYLLYRYKKGIIFYSIVILGIISLLNTFFEHFVLSVIAVSTYVLYIIYKDINSPEGLLYALTLLSLTTIVSYIAKILGIEIDVLVRLSEIDIALWGTLRSITPFVYLAILSSPIWIKIVSRNRKRYREERDHYLDSTNIDAEVLVLTLGIVLSLILYMLPYTKLLNPHSFSATTDIILYVKLLDEMEDKDPVQVAFQHFDRPLYLLLLYGLKKMFRCSSITIVIVSGWIWNSMLTLAIWLLAKEVLNRKAALIAAILTPLSHQSLSFIYGGFHANHFALSLLYTAMSLINNITKKKLILAVLLLSISILCHTWSWLHIAAAILLYSIVSIIRYRNLRKFYLTLSIVLIAILIVGDTFLGSVSRICGMVFRSPKFFLGLIEGLWAANGLRDAFTFYLWGAINVPILYVLALIVRLERRSFNILDALFIVSFAASIIFINDMTLITRLCINIPIQIEASNIERFKRSAIICIVTILLSNAIYMVTNAVPIPN